MSGALVVCPTPIGNLADVTLRVLDALRAADVAACEDTRHSQTLLRRHGISLPLISLTEHNEAARIPGAGRADRRRASASACSPTPGCRPSPTPARG